VGYVPGDSDSGMFGGNSNWRGPVWMPVNNLLYTALFRLYAYYGDDFKVECPTGSGNLMTLFEVAKEIGERLIRLFEQDSEGRRASHGSAKRFQKIRTGAIWFSSMNISTGTMAPASEPVIKLVGPASSPASSN
jgi:hypothetical protein